jgi:DeoR/GlpR family transcriptional regulator of sugar metabolism
MRAGGQSLRQIGDRLGVSKDTIQRDLARYEDQEVSHLLSHLALIDPLNATGNETP